MIAAGALRRAPRPRGADRDRRVGGGGRHRRRRARGRPRPGRGRGARARAQRLPVVDVLRRRRRARRGGAAGGAGGERARMAVEGFGYCAPRAAARDHRAWPPGSRRRRAPVRPRWRTPRRSRLPAAPRCSWWPTCCSGGACGSGRDRAGGRGRACWRRSRSGSRWRRRPRSRCSWRRSRHCSRSRRVDWSARRRDARRVVPPLLNANATILCSHGGMFTIMPTTAPNVLIGGAPALTVGDVMSSLPGGTPCPFATAAGPAPCIKLRVRHGRDGHEGPHPRPARADADDDVHHHPGRRGGARPSAGRPARQRDRPGDVARRHAPDLHRGIGAP